jgi:hypothetical protein
MKEQNVADLLRQNLRSVKQRYPSITTGALRTLSDLTRSLRLSVMLGEMLCIEGKWYVTHSGLLRIALRRRCRGIRTMLQERQSDPIAGRWVFKATVYKSRGSRGFGGYGDADPTNVSPVVRGAEMRVAETRAVNRALRKAYGIGICSVEELGSFSAQPQPSSAAARSNGHCASNGSSNGQPRLRDQLCLLIREYNLDPNLVKAYAADFCGTQTLSGASRELVESFISHLSASAKENRDTLVCKLNSYAQPQEAKS